MNSIMIVSLIEQIITENSWFNCIGDDYGWNYKGDESPGSIAEKITKKLREEGFDK